jgi:hypothetical protein
MIEYFDGWKSCFSNTFGFMVVTLFGVKKPVDTFFNEIMSGYSSSDKKEIFNMIYRDRSLILNELTPTNLKNLVEIMIGTSKYSEIINNPSFDNYTYKTSNIITPTQELAVKGMESILHRKDNVARFMWYVLAGCMTISLTHTLMMRPKCDVSVNDIKKGAVDSYDKTVETANNIDNRASDIKKSLGDASPT